MYLYLHVWPARGDVEGCQRFMEVTWHKLPRHDEPDSLDVRLERAWDWLHPA